MRDDSVAPLRGGNPPAPRRFTGRFVTLSPLDVAADVEELFAISHGGDDAPRLWRYLPCGPFASAADHADFLREWVAGPDVIAFVVRDRSTGRGLGTISLMNIRAGHGVAELGNIWYAPSARRTRANTEACHLLLRHCFEELRFRRMEWKCDSRNEPSQRAARRLGFSFEGIFRQHMIIKGESRDTAWFAMLDHEWPRLGAAMHHWLEADDPPSLGTLVTGATPSSGASSSPR